MTTTRDVLSDLLRAALDDERVRLPPLTERRVLARMCELAELAGIELVTPRSTTNHPDRAQP